MQHVIDTLEGADEYPDWSVSGQAMRWRPSNARTVEMVEPAVEVKDSDLDVVMCG